MSPEQALGARDKVDHRTDIWSLGATLFTAITGQTVHLGPNVQARLLAAAKMKARSIAMVKPDLPPPVAAAIDTALRFKKEDRWQSVDAFRRAFRDARVQLGLGEPEPPPRPSWFESQEAPALAGAKAAAPDLDRGEQALAMVVRSHRPDAPSPAGQGGGTYPARGGREDSTHPPSLTESEPSSAGFQSKTVRLHNVQRLLPPRSGGNGVPSRPVQEASYPGASNTVEVAGKADGRAHRPNVALWIGTCLLLALSGIALLAVSRGMKGSLGGVPRVSTPVLPVASMSSATPPGGLPMPTPALPASQSSGSTGALDAGSTGMARPTGTRMTHATPANTSLSPAPKELPFAPSTGRPQTAFSPSPPDGTPD